MAEKRGVLLLADPLKGGGCFSQMHIAQAQTLVFQRDGRLFSQAQDALLRARLRWDWVCAAAEGEAAWLVLALAAQLGVDRMALRFDGSVPSGGELRRIAAFARRNLALICGEMLLVDAPAPLLRRMAGTLGRSCTLRALSLEALRPERLTAPDF